MPLLDPRTDRSAAQRLKAPVPARRVVALPAREMRAGNIHCITQQSTAAGMSDGDRPSLPPADMRRHACLS